MLYGKPYLTNLSISCFLNAAERQNNLNLQIPASMSLVLQVDPTAHTTGQANLSECTEGSVLVVLPLI